jgi:shikimate dehydrogenase
MSERRPFAHDHKRLLGLIGVGIQHSLTPALQEQEAWAQGLRVHYQLIDLALDPQGVLALPGLMVAARSMGFAGLNITFPCKQAVLPLLDDISEEAQAMGAVNTVVFDGRRATGHNTDGSGWRWGMQQQLPNADLSRVVLLGAGGAGAAIAHALLRMHTQSLVLVDSDGARARQLSVALNAQYPAAGSHPQRGPRVSHAADAASALVGATGLVHATPTGMGKLPGLPLPAQLLRPDFWVSEIVYFPLQTELLRAAQAAGCAVCNGAGMAVGQAVGAFKLFTGLAPDARRMQAHMKGLLGTL